MRRWRQAARAAVGAGGGGPSGPALPLDWTTDLTFARASAATHWDGTTFRQYASGEARVLPSGDLYVEGERTNEVADHAAYEGSAAATVTDNATTAPDGTTTADRFESTAANGNLYVRPAASIPAVDHAASAFAKYVSGDTGFRLRMFGVGWLTSTSVDPLSSSWTRLEGVDATVSSGLPYLYVQEFDTNDDGAADVWGWQIEEGAFASQLIQTSGSAASRVADDATVASASVPDAMRSGSFEVTITPRRASTQAADASTETLFAFGSGTDNRIYLNASNQVVVRQGGSDVVTTGALTWDADQAITLTFDAAAGSVTVAGATTGDGTTTDTSWTMPSGDVQVGNDAALATPFFGAISAPAAP